MKSLGLAVVLSFFLISFTGSQIIKNDSAGRLYLKGGVDRSFHAYSGPLTEDIDGRKKRSFSIENWVSSFSGGLGIKLNSRINFELLYELLGKMEYFEMHREFFGNLPSARDFNSYTFTDFTSNEFSFRSIIFVNSDRTVNPVYFVTGLTLSFQPVNTKFVNEYDDRTETFVDSFNRISLGPVAGLGVFWDLGALSVTAELNIGGKISVNRKKFSETSFSINISPVLKL